MNMLATAVANPEQQTSQRELGALLESAILALPGKYRRRIASQSALEAAKPVMR